MTTLAFEEAYAHFRHAGSDPDCPTLLRGNRDAGWSSEPLAEGHDPRVGRHASVLPRHRLTWHSRQSHAHAVAGDQRGGPAFAARVPLLRTGRAALRGECGVCRGD